MTKKTILISLACVGVAVGQAKRPHKLPPKPETPHFDFVKEFVRELSEDEDLKTTAQTEFDEDKTPDQHFSAGIYYSKTSQLQLRQQIAMLKSMRLKAPFDTLIPTLTAFDQRQIELHQQLIEISSKFLAGPKPGVDYQALEAKVPQIRAELDDARKTLFQASPLVFMALIDQKPDSQGHLNHLVITKEEKTALEDQLNIMLKGIPDKGDQDYFISSAMVLRAGLQKGHKCSDEPWE